MTRNDGDATNPLLVVGGVVILALVVLLVVSYARNARLARRPTAVTVRAYDPRRAILGAA